MIDKLELKKIDGLRIDKKPFQPISLKKDTKLPESKKSMKTTENVKPGGYKY
ncbi:MAG: hypothetical protein ACKVJK_00825 [Methylophagaceae bacterium]|jgi:hypothetical protein|tara:strand:- start:343 stop:498 length:156 start_codon:yes stop_codon:yes gene_type:complete